MAYAKAQETQSKIALFTRLRLLLRRLRSRKRERAAFLDPSMVPDHILEDIGLSTPRQTWDETTGFWR